MRLGVTPPAAPVLAPHLINLFASQAPHVTVDLQRMWLRKLLDAACSPGTRRSRPWCSRNGSPPGTATTTCSSSAGVRSLVCDGPAHQDHHGGRGDGGGRYLRHHLVPACVRAGAVARGVWCDGTAIAVHGGRADLGGVHGGYWTPAAAASRYHGWPSGAWVPGSWPQLAPTWRTG